MNEWTFFLESSCINISNSAKYSVYVGVLEPIGTIMLAAKRVRMPHQLCIMCSIPIGLQLYQGLTRYDED